MQKTFFHHHIITAALLLTAALAGSCKKLIEIPPSPPTEISQSEQFADSASAMAAISYVYSYDANTLSGVGYADGQLTMSTGLSSDELTDANTYDAAGVEFYNYSLTNINGEVSSLWTSPYTSLYVVNAVISGVSGNAAMSPAFQTQITAEMGVMRALYYFNLVNLFGGVPLATTTNYQVNAVSPRASADSVYAQVMTDLTNAQQNLSASYPSPGHYRPCQLVATAFLARVYLYQQQWQNAYNAANTVISSGQYSLVTDPNQVFLDGSTEAIWQVPATGPNAVTAEAEIFIPQSSGTIPNYPLTTWLVNAFEPGDLRMQDWLGQVIVNGDTLYYPYKYKNVNPTGNATTEDYMILRLAEQYLIRAEASAELGNGAAALADVNTVRARAGLAPSTANPGSQAAVLAAIMHERQIELFTEWGNRWYDLKRTGAAASVLGTEKTGYTANAALYPVPLTQLQDDVNLKQNPGY